MDVLHAARALGERISQGPTLSFFFLTLALVLGPRLAQLVRLPAMVGLVLAGMGFGPHGARLLDPAKIALPALGHFGLLYLMFAAGLELDLKLFTRMKKVAITFALLSFAIPFTLGIVSAKLLGYAAAAAILMGSNWGSHTLVTYPMLRTMGLARNPAVSTVVGATALTDTSALVVLAGVSGSVKGSGGLALQSVEIVVGLVILAIWTLVALPRITRWFFAQVGAEQSYRFVFGMVAFLSGAVLAEAGSIDGIVGAFFAGLGLNRAIPEQSPLMDRVQFFGSALLIPIFLVSVGVLLEPKVMIDPKTLWIALVFTIAVLGGKALAAVIAGRAFHFSWPEVGVMSGLSGSQAAATLATTLIGAKLGIFDKVTINAVLVVILVSLVVTPAVVSFFGRKVPRAEGAAEAEAICSSILVPVWGESTKGLLGVAGRLATADGGIVVAASIATEDASEDEIAARRALKDRASEWLSKEGFESRSIFRVSSSLAKGLLQTLRGESATLLITEWHLEGLDPNSEASRLLQSSPVPILLAHGAIEPFERLVLASGSEEHAIPGRRDLEVAGELAERLAAGRPILHVGSGLDGVASLFTPKQKVARIESPDPLAWIHLDVREGDLVVLVGLLAARQALARFPSLSEPDRRFLVAIGPRGRVPRPRPRPRPREEEQEQRQGALIVGRSITERPPEWSPT
jgi:Kef-type K+ transport system membrane component KefB